MAKFKVSKKELMKFFDRNWYDIPEFQELEGTLVEEEFRDVHPVGHVFPSISNPPKKQIEKLDMAGLDDNVETQIWNNAKKIQELIEVVNLLISKQ